MAEPLTAAGQQIAEDTYEECSCVAPGGYGEPLSTCWHCKGSGYRLAKRVVRPQSFSEQAAYAEIKRLHGIILKAADTVDHAALRFDKANCPKDAQQTRAAAKAIRDTVAGQEATE